MPPAAVFDEYPALDRFFKSLGEGSGQELGLETVLLRLGLACVIGWLIGAAFRHTFTGKKFNASLPDTHMLLCLAGALIWIIVQDSMARAFGLAGTIGLVRYRTIVRDPKDTTLLLFSMMLGMACGLGQYHVALVGTMMVVFTLAWLQYRGRRQRAAEAKKSHSLMDLRKDDDDSGEDDAPQGRS